jgi:hypothetical protein
MTQHRQQGHAAIADPGDRVQDHIGADVFLAGKVEPAVTAGRRLD